VADGRLLDVVAALGVVLHLLAHVAEDGAGKEVGALGETRHARLVDEGGGLVAALELLEGVGTHVERAAAVGLPVEGILGCALAEPPRRPMTLPAADQPCRRGKRQVRRQLQGRGDGREPEA